MMFKKFNNITVILLLIVSIFNLAYNKPAFASTKKWYTATTYSDNKNVKVTINNSNKMTNKPVTITIDATKYNNGNNVILYNPGDNNFEVTYGSKYTIKAKANGNYDFLVLRKDYYDPKDPNLGDPNIIWCGATISNIDTSKPVLKFVKTYVDDWSTTQFLKIRVTDNNSIDRVKLPDGSYNSNIREIKGSEYSQGIDNSIEVEVYKNGKYTFVAEDYAGNKTVKTFTIKNCNPVPLKIDKVTVNSKYITGKTLPNADLIVKTSDLSYYVDNIKADKKGYFKAKLNKKLKLNKVVVVRVVDSKKKSKYSSNKLQVKVVKK
ncbi:hypothetical protein KHA93_16365 [Bacillus sp. FJAT-49732]|uniref:Bacterial Ig domain-containing protein n=1 Tax=Lederbergia citrisecunda TaxID=2833583 RepID=A0A942YL87_9BACI|nr:hypothetical protein [Lederbergia citrisecunda]MBS4201213.1 hypothetical protein [Lederbergia citrisecunda]